MPCLLATWRLLPSVKIKWLYSPHLKIVLGTMMSQSEIVGKLSRHKSSIISILLSFSLTLNEVLLLLFCMPSFPYLIERVPLVRIPFYILLKNSKVTTHQPFNVFILVARRSKTFRLFHDQLKRIVLDKNKWSAWYKFVYSDWLSWHLIRIELTPLEVY